MKTKNCLFLFLILIFSISFNAFAQIDLFKNPRLKDLENKINQSNKYSEIKKNIAIASVFLTSVAVLCGWTYRLKQKSDYVAKREEENKQQMHDYHRLKGIEELKNLDIKNLKKKFDDLSNQEILSLHRIINEGIEKEMNLDGVTLDEFIEMQQKADKVDPKKDNENVVCKVILDHRGLETVTCDFEKLRVVGSEIDKKIDVWKSKSNFIKAILKEQPPVQDVSEVTDVENPKN